MSQSNYDKPFENTPGLAPWKPVIDAEHGELYAFSEDITFSRPAANEKIKQAHLKVCQNHLEAVGAAAVAGLSALSALPDQITVHMSDDQNFIQDAMAHIAGILAGDSFYLPYMTARAPASSAEERLIGVRIEGVITTTEHGASVYFNAKLLAVEVNARTGQYTIVQIIEKGSDSAYALNTLPEPTQGGVISTTLGDRSDSPPLNAFVSFLPTGSVRDTDETA